MTNTCFQDLIDAMSENVAIVDETGRILYTNKAWVEFSENNSGPCTHTNESENYFTSVEMAAENGDEYAQKVNTAIRDIISNKTSDFELEYPCHSKQVRRWFIANIKEIHSYSPRLFLFSHKNVSQLVEREEKALEAQRLEAIGQLSGGIAHDFNNLLGIIMGNIELAQLIDSQNGCIDEYLKNSITAINRGASLIQKLLSFAREQNLKLENINVNTFIISTLEFMRPALGEDIDIVTELNDTPLTINVDSSMLGSAILNIAINARHAMPTGGRLTLNTSFAELYEQRLLTGNEVVSGSYAVISISDTGAGIDEKIIHKVFEPFFTTKQAGNGSGLGLSMVFGFIKQSDGYIDIVSRTDEGTTICLYLPTVQENTHETDVHKNMHAVSLSHKTLLLVEDNQEFLSTATKMLEILGCEVIQCRDGKSAIKTINENKHKIDILLTDVIMPGGMNGIELSQEVHHLDSNIKTLFMSGYPHKRLKYSNIDTLTPILRKPFSLEQLSIALQDL